VGDPGLLRALVELILTVLYCGIWHYGILEENTSSIFGDQGQAKQSTDFLFMFKKNKCIHKNGLGNAHLVLCSTFLQTPYSIIAVTLPFFNISLNSKNILLIICAHTSFSF
jgi:hypothetical protein